MLVNEDSPLKMRIVSAMSGQKTEPQKDSLFCVPVRSNSQQRSTVNHINYLVHKAVPKEPMQAQRVRD